MQMYQYENSQYLGSFGGVRFFGDISERSAFKELSNRYHELRRSIRDRKKFGGIVKTRYSMDEVRAFWH